MKALKMTFALLVATVLMTFLGIDVAMAGKTVMEKDYVGNVENLDPGYKDGRDEPEGIARFAGSGNTIAEGSPHGDSEEGCDPSTQTPSDNGCVEDYEDRLENFWTSAQPVPGTSSVNGFDVYENTPRCRDLGSTPGGIHSVNAWTFAIERPPVTDFQVQICLDVRKCQGEDDLLGQANTPADNHLKAPGGEWIAPVLIRVSHQSGDLWLDPPFTTPRPVEDIRNPGMHLVAFPQGVCVEGQDGICANHSDCDSKPLPDDHLGFCEAEVYGEDLENVTEEMRSRGVCTEGAIGKYCRVGYNDMCDLPDGFCLGQDKRLDSYEEALFSRNGQNPLIPDLHWSDRPYDRNNRLLLEESIAFIGQDCTTKWIHNDGMYSAHDLIKVELSVPSGIDVRVRTSQDAAALCYIGSLLPGEL